MADPGAALAQRAIEGCERFAGDRHDAHARDHRAALVVCGAQRAQTAAFPAACAACSNMSINSLRFLAPDSSVRGTFKRSCFIDRETTSTISSESAPRSARLSASVKALPRA